MAELLPLFSARREASDERLAALSAQIDAMPSGGEPISAFAAGSVARGEATSYSDLDLFILDTADETQGEVPATHLAATLLRADLIRASETIGFPPFSGDGRYLDTHSVTDLIARTGRSDDDFSNALTVRLLLVLESRPVLNKAAFEIAQQRIVDSYWRDYPRDAFVPVFLINDVMRYWKTVGINYEADRTSGAPTGYDATRWRQRNRLKNVKLKFSRLWTCHATTAHLLYLSRLGRSVEPDDALRMLNLTPAERLASIEGNEASALVAEVLGLYAWFLNELDGSREENLAWVADDSNYSEARARGVAFGEAMAALLAELGSDSPLYRYLLV